MSFIISENTTDSVVENFSEAGGLVLQPANAEEPLIIEVKGDAEAEITGGQLGDLITTGAGDAIIFSAEGDDEVLGGIGNDIIRGGDDDDIIKGGLGADLLIGGAGDDILNGGLGGEDAEGNPLGDTLKGGTGNDIFQFAVGPDGEFKDGEIDEIVDFKADGFADTIKLFGLGSTNPEAVTYDPETGMISINGQEAIDIGTDQEVSFKVSEDGDTWELF